VGVQAGHLAGIRARVDADVGRYGRAAAVDPHRQVRVRMLVRARCGHRRHAGGDAALLEPVVMLAERLRRFGR